ncbi:MAG: isopentenyl phosphate kinase family protein [Thermoproteales archaeon]|nr:isopentenyl phosphate kinase family protein [Thermoproteales archaeon]
MDTLIIKLGGSAITNKERRYEVRRKVVERIAKEVKILSKNYKLVLVHGGGSFGHPTAKEYNIHLGYFSNHQLIGYSKVRYFMTQLNQIILEYFIKSGVPAVTLHTSNILKANDGKISSFNIELLIEYMKMGFTPVVYGDAVLDEKRGFSIISGDQIVSYLAIRLKPIKVILGTDVDGIYTGNPKKDSNAKLVKTLKISKLITIKADKPMIDVTGGIVAKIDEMRKVVKAGIPVIIGNIVSGNLIDLVEEKTPKYTKIIM